MENPEEILHCLEEFSKLKPKDIPRELEEYLCFVAKTGDPVYQWSAVKSLFREKMINVITEFYESCPTVEIPPCPNVEMFNYDSMKNFILEKLDTFAAAPFTVQRICELLTTPRKEYNRIDKYMRALEKNILVVSTTEPANRRNTENGEGIVNGIETEHITEANSSNDINVEEMDDSPSWPRLNQPESNIYADGENATSLDVQPVLNVATPDAQDSISSTETRITSIEPSTSNMDSVITCMTTSKPYVSIEPIIIEREPENSQDDVSVTITAIPAPVQKRRDSIEPLTSDDNAVSESISSNSTEEVMKQKSEPTTEDKLILTSDTAENTETEIKKPSIEEDEKIPSDSTPEITIDKSVETEELTEQTDNTKADEPQDLQKDAEEKEIVPPNPVPENESDTPQACDNTCDTQTAEMSSETPIENLQESPAVEETPEEKSPSDAQPNDSITSKMEEMEEAPPSDDKSTKDPTADTEVEPPTATNKIGDTEEETPMEVDPDENLVKEPDSDIPNIETNPN